MIFDHILSWVNSVIYAFAIEYDVILKLSYEWFVPVTVVENMFYLLFCNLQHFFKQVLFRIINASNTLFVVF